MHKKVGGRSGIRVDVYEELVGGPVGGGQGGCVRRIKVIVKMQKKKVGGRCPFRGDPVLGQGGCVRRIEVFLKMQKVGGPSVGLGGWFGWSWLLAARLGFSG